MRVHLMSEMSYEKGILVKKNRGSGALQVAVMGR